VKTKQILLTAILLALLAAPSFVTGVDTAGIIKGHNVLRLWPYTPVAAEGARKCPICSGILPAAVVDAPGPAIFDELLGAKVQELASCKFIVPSEQRRITYAADSKEDQAKIKSLASLMGADAIIYPVLLRYRERVGGAFAASKPAAVVFHIYLLDAKNLNIIWKAEYAEEQQPLSENILLTNLMIKRKFRFVTADRLIEDGLNKVFKNFPPCEGTTQ